MIAKQPKNKPLHYIGEALYTGFIAGTAVGGSWLTYMGLKDDRLEALVGGIAMLSVFGLHMYGAYTHHKNSPNTYRDSKRP